MSTNGTNRLLVACAWCERSKLEDAWAEAGEAIARLRTFDWPHPPVFTHTICGSCLGRLTAARIAAASER